MWHLCISLTMKILFWQELLFNYCVARLHYAQPVCPSMCMSVCPSVPLPAVRKNIQT